MLINVEIVCFFHSDFLCVLISLFLAPGSFSLSLSAMFPVGTDDGGGVPLSAAPVKKH